MKIKKLVPLLALVAGMSVASMAYATDAAEEQQCDLFPLTMPAFPMASTSLRVCLVDGVLDLNQLCQTIPRRYGWDAIGEGDQGLKVVVDDNGTQYALFVVGDHPEQLDVTHNMAFQTGVAMTNDSVQVFAPEGYELAPVGAADDQLWELVLSCAVEEKEAAPNAVVTAEASCNQTLDASAAGGLFSFADTQNLDRCAVVGSWALAYPGKNPNWVDVGQKFCYDPSLAANGCDVLARYARGKPQGKTSGQTRQSGHQNSDCIRNMAEIQGNGDYIMRLDGCIVPYRGSSERPYGEGAIRTD